MLHGMRLGSARTPVGTDSPAGNRNRPTTQGIGSAGRVAKSSRSKIQDCTRAFRDYFDRAQSSTNREEAISLYRQGLAICPDDDVAHYELGRALADAGRPAEAAEAFEAALKINPDFADAKRQLDAVRNSR